MKINTHGIKMIGLRKASGETRNYGDYDSRYDELFYDRASGEVWTVYQVSMGCNSWTEYHASNIVKICNAHHHMTMQQIADAICQRLQEIDACRAYA